MDFLRKDKIVDLLICPICRSQMEISQEGRSLYCQGSRRHTYDFSSSGYVNLASPSQSNGGDSKSAVRARTAFLDEGHYAPIANKVCLLLDEYASKGGIVIDAGCGEGYYSKHIIDNGFGVMGFDLSKHAVDVAAKRTKHNENAFFGVASVFSLPIENKSADAVVNIFAPCVENEYSRVLSDDGTLIVVHAGKEHLLGLKRVVYNEIHLNEERADLPQDMKLIDNCELKYEISLEGTENIKNLFAMTPYYWKTSKSDIEKLENVKNLTTTIDIMFSVYKKI